MYSILYQIESLTIVTAGKLSQVHLRVEPERIKVPREAIWNIQKPLCASMVHIIKRAFKCSKYVEYFLCSI